MQDQVAVVTGITGFLGGALAERLLDEGYRVRAAGRKLGRLERGLLANPAEDLRSKLDGEVHFDLGDTSNYAEVVAGADVVFHVAAWMGGDPDKAVPFNVDATAALVRAAREAGVRRFVHISSVAVYGLPTGDSVTESHPLDTTQSDTYGRTKALGEQAAREAAGDLDLVIVRPSMIYGPRSRAWTTGMIKLLKQGLPTLFGRADGHALPIYVDNLLDALILCATHPEAKHDTFHIADAPVTWRLWFERYGAMCNRKPRRVPLFLARLLAVTSETFSLGLPLSPAHLAMYQRKLTYETPHARTVLGWESRVSFDEGMRRAEAWLRTTDRI